MDSTTLTSEDSLKALQVKMRPVLLEDGWKKLQDLAHLPRTWPSAHPTVPLEGLSKQIDRLLEGSCLQILAPNRNLEVHNRKVLQMVLHLAWILAEYLADTLAWLMRSKLEHDTKILCDKDTASDFQVLDLAAISETFEQCTAQPVQSLLEKSTGFHWLG